MTPTTELVIARHGEAACNVTGIVGGEHGCTGLTDRGRHQVTRLAARLAVEHTARPYAIFYSTPRLRVVQTAEIIRQALQLPPDVEPELRGPDHGDADGQPWADVKTAFQGPPQHAPDIPYANGSETWNQYLARATKALQKILARHDGERILIAAHGETIEAANNLLLALPQNTCLRLGFVTDHASVTRWQRPTNRFGRTIWQLAAHNDTRHLQPER
ncbi:histidine phosphatase family protein [Plantactinospora soyae]|jgi:probable phosphoglycerate mutase|uniref:Phosphoglycerate mutase n=1 Tax=Plantactinospora soyae TaxID=1544732 RepID=A0A927M676_9ACTN|nr:histidine phosphatase family protein [Plantactinospora soyae]MBE1487496.1 putative phosphoglycerate mutase [Plantactinospora soyae]